MAIRRWPIQDAKQQFSALLRAVSGEGVQVVTKHGVDVAAVVPMEEYRRLIGDRDFKEFLNPGSLIVKEGCIVEPSLAKAAPLSWSWIQPPPPV